MSYELVVGLETHIELKTQSKIFCGCQVAFGGQPNARCCPICLGLPGSLPSLNRQAVTFAVQAGLALHCEISSVSKFDRKNYYYPDLPKGYQITQHHFPLCQNGWLLLSDHTKVPIIQIHLEEDAGKLLHRSHTTLVDFNRAGVPLIEIVTAPAFSSAAQASEYLNKIRLIMKYLGISDCRMQEGSLRCDVNISVRLPNGRLGPRVEMKNLNSISNVEKAIIYEFNRQKSILEKGECVLPETRRYNEDRGETEKMRSKEKLHDYRYFPEPDLPPLHLSSSDIHILRNNQPELPDEKYKRFQTCYSLPPETARLLVQYPAAAQFFEESAENLSNPIIAANLIVGQFFSTLHSEIDKENFNVSVSIADFHKLLLLLEQSKINSSMVKKLLDEMLCNKKTLNDCISTDDLKPFSSDEMKEYCKKAMAQLPLAVLDYQAGKHKALKVLVGSIMKQSQGRADPVLASQYLHKLMNE